MARRRCRWPGAPGRQPAPTRLRAAAPSSSSSRLVAFSKSCLMRSKAWISASDSSALVAFSIQRWAASRGGDGGGEVALGHRLGDDRSGSANRGPACSGHRGPRPPPPHRCGEPRPPLPQGGHLGTGGDALEEWLDLLSQADRLEVEIGGPGEGESRRPGQLGPPRVRLPRWPGPSRAVPVRAAA